MHGPSRGTDDRRGAEGYSLAFFAIVDAPFLLHRNNAPLLFLPYRPALADSDVFFASRLTLVNYWAATPSANTTADQLFAGIRYFAASF